MLNQREEHKRVSTLNLLQELRTKRGSGLVMHTIFGGGD